MWGKLNYLYLYREKYYAAEEASIPLVTCLDINVGLLFGVKYEPIIMGTLKLFIVVTDILGSIT